MDRSHRLGELQHAIMRVLWSQGEGTVAEVHAALVDDHERALTTIATMLSKMEKKGVVAHRLEGRQFVYRPTVSEEQVARTMVADLTRQVFRGDLTALVSHLLSEQDIEPDELTRLRELVEERQRREEESDGRE